MIIAVTFFYEKITVGDKGWSDNYIVNIHL